MLPFVRIGEQTQGLAHLLGVAAAARRQHDASAHAREQFEPEELFEHR